MVTSRKLYEQIHLKALCFQNWDRGAVNPIQTLSSRIGIPFLIQVESLFIRPHNINGAETNWSMHATKKVSKQTIFTINFSQT